MSSSSPQNSGAPRGLPYFLASACAFLLGWSLSQFRTPKDKPINSILSPTTKATDENEQSQTFPLLSTQIPPAPSSQENTCKCSHHETPWWKIALEVGTFLVALGAFIAASIYAGISLRIWKEMRTQNGMQRDAAINSERAWIGLDGTITIDALELTPRLKVESHYRIRNFGHGPAVKVFPIGFFWDITDLKTTNNLAKSLCTMATKFATGSVPSEPSAPNPGPFGFTLFPNEPQDETIGSPADPWQGDAQPNLRHFFLIGCIAYVDQFKISRWTRFCMEPDISSRHPMEKDIPLSFCNLYNDTSDTEETEK